MTIGKARLSQKQEMNRDGCVSDKRQEKKKKIPECPFVSVWLSGIILCKLNLKKMCHNTLRGKVNLEEMTALF